MRKNSLLLKTVILTIVLSLTLPVISSFAISERVNLINNSTTVVGNDNGKYENGVFTNTASTGEQLLRFTVPGLRNQYTWSGDVKILEYGTDAVSNGVRFCIGYDEATGNYVNLITTKSIGISAEKKGSTYESDIYPLTKDYFSTVLDVNSEFHFEIKKQGEYVMMKIDDKVVMNTSFPESYDFFTPGYDLNLGFFGAQCSFEVRNLEVYNEPEMIIKDKSTLAFDSLAAGALAKGTYDNWYIEWPSTNKSLVESSNGMTYLKVEGYFQSVFNYMLTDEYKFSMDMLGTDLNQNLGLFVRSSREKFLSNSAGAPHQDYFEADGDGGIGSTGIYLKPLNGSNIVRIAVKAYDASKTKKITQKFVDIDISSLMGSDTLLTAITNFRFEDNGYVIKVFVKDTLIATIELSTETITYPEFKTIKNKFSIDKYVKTVTIKSAAGDTLLTVGDTLVSADYSIIGVGARNIKPTYIDNLSAEITLDVLPPITEPVSEPVSEPSTINPQTGDSALLIMFIVAAALTITLFKKKTANI